MRRSLPWVAGLPLVFSVLLLVHWPLLHLPCFWDEAGYYIPAALDFYHLGKLIPESTLPTGHTPLVMVYLALAWKMFGFSPPVTRLVMALVAAGTVTATYALGRRVAGAEAAAWSAALLSSLTWGRIPCAEPLGTRPRLFVPEHDTRYNQLMNRDTAEILKEALALPGEARAALADCLLDSLDAEVDADGEAAWQLEIQRRVAELDSKAVSPIPWAEVRSRLMATLRNER
jgi:putative addiction module component (TIGR02574 family)